MAIWGRMGWLSEDQGLGTMSTKRFRWEHGSVRVLVLWSPGNGFLHQVSLGGGACQGPGRGGMGEVMKVCSLYLVVRFSFLICQIVVQWLSPVQFFGTPWAAARQAFLSSTISRSMFMTNESVMLSNHLISCCPHLLLPSIFPNI